MHFTYLLLCADNTFYVGSTNNVERRVHQHNHAKSGAHYTKIRRPVVLQYAESCETYAEARAKEAQWKRMSRTQKLAMVQMKGEMRLVPKTREE